MFSLALLGTENTLHRLAFLGYLPDPTGSPVCLCEPCIFREASRRLVDALWRPSALRALVKCGVVDLILRLLRSLQSDQDFVWNAAGVLCACSKDEICRQSIPCEVVNVLLSLMHHAAVATPVQCSSKTLRPAGSFVKLRIDWSASLYCLQWLCCPETQISDNMRAAVRAHPQLWKGILSGFLALGAGLFELNSLSALVDVVWVILRPSLDHRTLYETAHILVSEMGIIEVLIKGVQLNSAKAAHATQWASQALALLAHFADLSSLLIVAAPSPSTPSSLPELRRDMDTLTADVRRKLSVNGAREVMQVLSSVAPKCSLLANWAEKVDSLCKVVVLVFVFTDICRLANRFWMTHSL